MLSPLIHVVKIVTIAAMAVLVAFGGRTFFDYYQEQESDPMLGRPFNLRVVEEDTGETLATSLANGDMIRSELYFTTALRLTGGDLSPGTYKLLHGMSVTEIIDTITIESEGGEEEDQTAAAEELELVFPEGQRFGEMADVVEEADLPWGVEEFIAAVEQAPRSRFDFLDSVPDDVSIEGYLFPATYQVNTDWTAEDLVVTMLGKFGEEFVPSMEDRADEMGLTIHEVVTLASIVERETSLDEERPMVAQVYLNRLNSDETFGLLQADPTVVYALGDESEWWPPLERNQANEDPDVTDNPYNTYVFAGLPPGPICNPGVQAILGVLSPDGSNNFYFVATGDGGHAFAETLEEHAENVDEYLNS